jgi:hypothetical protein
MPEFTLAKEVVAAVTSILAAQVEFATPLIVPPLKMK